MATPVERLTRSFSLLAKGSLDFGVTTLNRDLASQYLGELLVSSEPRGTKAKADELHSAQRAVAALFDRHLDAKDWNALRQAVQRGEVSTSAPGWVTRLLEERLAPLEERERERLLVDFSADLLELKGRPDLAKRLRGESENPGAQADGLHPVEWQAALAPRPIVQKDVFSTVNVTVVRYQSDLDAVNRQYGVTKDETAALSEYVGPGFRAINRYLKKGTIEDSDRGETGRRTDAYLAEVCTHLDSLLVKLPKYEGVTYRGGALTPEQFQAMVDSNQFSSPGYLSADLTLQTAWWFVPERPTERIPVLFVIDSTRGAKTHLLHGNGMETEVVFPAGAKFQVADVDRSQLPVRVLLRDG